MPWNFNSYTEACDFYGVDSAAQLEAAMVAQYTLDREAMMDEMEAYGSPVGPSSWGYNDLNDEIPY